jgi:hypothetical protein
MSKVNEDKLIEASNDILLSLSKKVRRNRPNTKLSKDGTIEVAKQNPIQYAGEEIVISQENLNHLFFASVSTKTKFKKLRQLIIKASRGKFHQ